jgi:5-hydroxyisourate hydrolase
MSMAPAPPTISTHVLDTGMGVPAMNLPVRISRRLADGALVPAGEGRTDIDGRIRSLLHGPLTPGLYRITFEIHDYRPQAFFREVSLELRVEDTTRSYHVPLLLSPYGVTTYRGS